jgi:hypothetical protein
MAGYFDGRVAVVTGASRGIGALVAAGLAAKGCRTVLVARSAEALGRAAAGVARAGGESIAAPGDVREPETALLACRTAVERFGRLDVVVNCAGTFIPTGAAAFEPEPFREVIETNLLGTIYFCQAALAHMTPAGHGRIVNVSSLAGKLTFSQSAAYSASKFAVIAYSDRLRQELHGTGVKVSTVMPGFTDTEMLDKFRAGLKNDLYLRATTIAPARVSRAILDAIPRGKADVYVTLWDAVVSRVAVRAPRH